MAHPFQYVVQDPVELIGCRRWADSRLFGQSPGELFSFHCKQIIMHSPAPATGVEAVFPRVGYLF
jgi:hypothetical protein